METDLFSVETVELNATTDTDVITTTTQPSFVTNATDRLGLRIFASTTNNSAVTVTVTVGDGNATFFNTPLAIRHSQLRARDAYDSHPISAITSLQSTLDGKADLSGATFTGDIIVPDEAYDATTWNGNLEVPTKNAIRDKIESMGSGGSSLWTAVTGTRTSDTTFTLTGDVTSTFSRGLVIKWTESSSKKCGYVVSSSYSSPDTTVTIIGDTMAYIDSSSLKWTAIPAQSMRFAVAGSIGAT